MQILLLLMVVYTHWRASLCCDGPPEVMKKSINEYFDHTFCLTRADAEGITSDTLMVGGVYDCGLACTGGCKAFYLVSKGGGRKTCNIINDEQKLSASSPVDCDTHPSIVAVWRKKGKSPRCAPLMPPRTTRDVTIAIPKSLEEIAFIYIRGTPVQGSTGFKVDIRCEPDTGILLHMTNHFYHLYHPRTTELASNFGNTWENRQFPWSDFPFNFNEIFSIKVSTNGSEFEISVNDKYLATYPQMAGRARYVVVGGDLKIHCVEFVV